MKRMQQTNNPASKYMLISFYAYLCDVMDGFLLKIYL